MKGACTACQGCTKEPGCASELVLMRSGTGAQRVRRRVVEEPHLRTTLQEVDGQAHRYREHHCLGATEEHGRADVEHRGERERHRAR